MRKIYEFRAPNSNEFAHLDAVHQQRIKTTLQQIQTGELKFTLSDLSKRLFQDGKSEQGYVGFLDLESGEVDLVPAYNKNDGKERQNFLGNHYYVESREELGQNTGQVHMDGLKKIKKGDKGGKAGLIAGFGVFKGVSDDNLQSPALSQFRNKSFSQNRFAFQYDELFLLVNYEHMYFIIRSIPNQITKQLKNDILNQVPLIESQQTRSISSDHTLDMEKIENEFLKISADDIKNKLIQAMFSALEHDELDVIDRIIKLSDRDVAIPGEPSVILGDLGLSINAATENGTLLSAALASGKSKKIMNELIKLGADPALLAAEEQITLQIIRTNSVNELVNAGFEKEMIRDVSINLIKRERISEVADQVAILRELQQVGLISELDTMLLSILRDNTIPEKEKANLVIAMIEAGANPNVEVYPGQPLIHFVIENSISEIAQAVLMRGVDVNLKNMEGDTPLHLAAQKGNDKLLLSILQHPNFDKNSLNSNGKYENTPLRYAIMNGRVNCVEYLLKMQSNPNIPYPELIHATENGNEKIIDLLLQYKADVNQRDYLTNNTPLHVAARKCSFEVVIKLIQAGADPLAVNDDGMKPIETAFGREEFGAEFNNENEIVFALKAYEEGSTPLCQAALDSDNEHLQELLLHGCKPDEKDRRGRTPLDIARNLGNKQIIETLEIALAKIDDKKLKSNTGSVALHGFFHHKDDPARSSQTPQQTPRRSTP